MTSFIKLLILGGLFITVTGCSLVPKAKVGKVTAAGPRDAGTPAVVHVTQAGEAMTVPAGSLVKITETPAQPAKPAIPATAEAPAVAAQPAIPASRVIEVVPAAPMAVTRTERQEQASTGTVDTSVAQHRIDVEERRWLLWTAIACGLLGIVVRSMMPAWPSLSNGLLAAAVLAGLAWKVSALPSWVWTLALVGVGLLALGYKRAEWDKDGDGIPDVLERKKGDQP